MCFSTRVETSGRFSRECSTSWAVFGYAQGGKKIILQASGSGNWEEFTNTLKQDQVQFGFVRMVSDPETNRIKFVFISWIGNAVSVLMKAKVSVHKASVKEIVRDFAVEMHAEDLSELEYGTVHSKIVKAGGANYGTGATRETSLEHKIQSRPEKKDLVDKNILKEGNPRLQSAQEALKKEKVVDTLEKRVSNRPEKEELENRNILKHGNVAPALQATQAALVHEKLQDTLEHRLENRPQREDLENRNILHDDSVAPSLQAAKHSLEKEQIADRLEHNLERRPAAEDLENRNILHDTSVAPSLQAAKHALEKEIIADQLEHNLERRPAAEDLENRNILHDTSVAPSLHAAKHALEKEQLTDKLEHSLENRPDVSTLVEKHIIPAPDSQEEDDEQ